MRRMLLTALFLGGCANHPTFVCLSTTPYDRETQARALAELEALPSGSVIARMIDDYGDLRARIRSACQ